MATQWSDDIAIAELTDEPAFSDELNGLIARIQENGQGAPHWSSTSRASATSTAPTSPSS